LRCPAALLAIVAGSSLLSCSPTYVLRAAWEEARILWNRRPIAELLEDRDLDLETRSKLELVVEARAFAERELGLDVGDSYTSFTDIGRDTLALVLSAAPPDRLVPYTWWFPIVGRVPYKGFFDTDAAESERRRLEEQGYDTYLRPTSAFSTLGWLPDPLLSTLLRQDPVGLAETVIHEVTHNTLFVSGHVKFNESFANYVGSTGAIEFFCRPNRDPDACETAQARWHDAVRVSAFLDGLWTELTELYAMDLSRGETVERRRQILSEAAERYGSEYAPGMRTGWARFDPSLLNNASLIARHLYYHRLPLFDALHREHGLRGSLDRIVQAVDGADDPWAALARLAGPAAVEIAGNRLHN
jgi:predicted aminopeptidase